VSTPPPDVDACSVTEGCITCGDVAVPLIVVDVAGPDARCRDEQGREETVATELVGPVSAGDRVLVHAGVAIQRLAPAEPTAGRPASWR
jgi:hydrogenase expression/formation protein HypC